MILRLSGTRTSPQTCAFTAIDLLVVIAVVAVLLAIIVPVVRQAKAGSRRALCVKNIAEVSKAVLLYAKEHNNRLPYLTNAASPGVWWKYKEMVKGYAGLKGPPSSNDVVFACPNDRGYSDEGEAPRPFRHSQKFDYGSYVFNGVTLPGVPNLAGRPVDAILDPRRTLLVSEWTANAPLSWHKSRTGRANHPFYNNAESIVAYADGHVSMIKIYYDGLNPAYSRDPIPGYEYKRSAE